MHDSSRSCGVCTEKGKDEPVNVCVWCKMTATTIETMLMMVVTCITDGRVGRGHNPLLQHSPEFSRIKSEEN